MNKTLLKISLSGQVRPKKNSKRVVRVHGRPMVISSKRYMEWHKSAISQLEEKNVSKSLIDSPIEVRCTFFQEDNRKRDLTNMIESVNDLLVDYEFLKDDDRKIIKKVVIFDGGVRKENPGANLIVKEYSEEKDKEWKDE